MISMFQKKYMNIFESSVVERGEQKEKEWNELFSQL